MPTEREAPHIKQFRRIAESDNPPDNRVLESLGKRNDVADHFRPIGLAVQAALHQLEKLKGVKGVDEAFVENTQATILDLPDARAGLLYVNLPNTPKPRSKERASLTYRGGDTRIKFLKAIQAWERDKPGIPVNLALIGKSLGKTRERARQLYNKLIAAGHKLPPKQTIENRVARKPESLIIENRIKDLFLDGTTSPTEIAKILEISNRKAEYHISRLRQMGELPDVQTSKELQSAQKAFEKQVRQLRREGLGDIEIQED